MHEAAKMVRQEKLLRLVMCGYMLRECCEPMGLSYSTLRKYAKESSFMEELRKLSEEVYARVDEELSMKATTLSSKIEEMSEKALQTLEAMLDSDKDAVKLKAATEVLDRNPETSKTRKVEQTNRHDFVTPLTLIHAAKAAQEVDLYNDQKKLSDGESRQQ